MTSWDVYSQYLPPCHEFWTEYSICLKDRLRTCLNLVVWCHPLLLVVVFIAHPTICTSEQSVPPLLIPSSSSAFEQIKELKHLCVLNHPLPRITTSSMLILYTSRQWGGSTVTMAGGFILIRTEAQRLHPRRRRRRRAQRKRNEWHPWKCNFPDPSKPCTDQWSTMS